MKRPFAATVWREGDWYFPRVEGAPANAAMRMRGEMPKDTETVLVEENVIRSVVVQIFEPQGYTVLEARQGRQGASAI
jgi:hypothetical protein